MAAIPYHECSTLDAPILELADAAVVGISATWNSEPVDLAGFTHICLLYAVVGAGTHNRFVQLSNDGVAWHDIQGTGEMINANMNGTAQASGLRAFLFATNAVRYLRLQIVGNAGNTLTLNATISLCRRA